MVHIVVIGWAVVVDVVLVSEGVHASLLTEKILKKAVLVVET